MAKRFTDSDKWKRKWFRDLTPAHKLFWQYLADNCNHGGIWEVDFGLASFQIGVELDEDEINRIFGDRITVLDNGERWFINNFVDFQYGELKKNNNVHLSVAQILSKYGLHPSNGGLSQPLASPSSGDKDKAKDMVKEKDKDGVRVTVLDPVPSSSVNRKQGTLLDDIRKQDEEVKQKRKLSLLKETFNLEEVQKKNDGNEKVF
jgi:hypothetical protein